MRRARTQMILLAAMVAVAIASVVAAPAVRAQSASIDRTQQYAWGENAGWFFLRPPSYGGVTVYSTWLTGYAWQENVGWVRFGKKMVSGVDVGGPYANDSATNWGVNLDATTGALSGWAWAENAGWIRMDPSVGSTSYGVILNSVTHEMDGYAWSENLGWIHFRGASTGSPSTAYGVSTSCDPGAPFTLAASTVSGFCGVRLSWSASTSLCTQPVTYTILRSTTAGGVSTAIAKCVTGTTYDDDATPSGTYYYRVQTEDGSSGSTGACNGGRISGFSPEASDASTCSTPPKPFRVFSATSTNAAVFLQWLNPASCTVTPFYAAIRYLSDGSGSYPADNGAGTGVPVGTQACGTTNTGSVSHGSLTNTTTYRYSAFSEGTSGVWSSRKTTWGRPFDSTTGKVKWAYTTGASAMVQPGNNQATGASSVLFVSNDRVLHAAVGGAGTTGGQWPTDFVPQAMNAPSQAWPGIVPGMTSVAGADRVAFISSQDGKVYAHNVATGASIWSTASLGDALQGAVAGIFAEFGGPSGVNRLFVGTRNATSYNKIYGIEAASGATAWTFDNGGATAANAIGIISSMPAVDYSSGKVYVTSRQMTDGTTKTLWCLTHAGVVCGDSWVSPALGDIDSSPNVRSGFVYVGNNVGLVYKIDARSGITSWTSPATSDGPVRVGLWVDETADRVYFSTNGKIWALVASTGDLVGGWPVTTIASPSYPVKVNGKLYVGSSDGKLYQVDATTRAITSVVLGDGTVAAAVGVPAYNGLDQMFYVGTEAGVVYAVQAPLQ